MKTLLPLVLLLLSAAFLSAQPRFGVRAGAQVSTARGTFLDHESYYTGPAVALPVDFRLARRLALRVEPSVSRGGWQSDRLEFISSSGEPLGKGRLKQTYWSAALPLVLSYAMLQRKTFTVRALTGPSLAYVFGGVDRLKGPTLSTRTALKLDPAYELSWALGGNVSFNRLRFQPYVDVRYQQGLTPYPLTPSESNASSHGFTLSVGVWLNSPKSSSPE